MPTYGNTLQIFSITFRSQLWSITKSSVFMEVSVLPLTLSKTSGVWIEFKKFLTKVQCVIFSGQIQMIDVAGEYHQEVQDTHLVKISVKRSITTMAWLWSLELINWSWKGIIGVKTVMWSPFSVHRITAIVVAIKLRSWKLMNILSILCKSISCHLRKANVLQPSIWSMSKGWRTNGKQKNTGLLLVMNQKRPTGTSSLVSRATE